MKKLQGVFTALITPFKGQHNEQVDYDALEKLLQQQVEASVAGVVMLGTTGESPTIDDEEREAIIRLTVKQLKGKAKVIIGTGSNNTKKTIEATKKAESLGADAALIITPYYNKPSQEGIYLHFKAIAESSKLPVIVYNSLGRTGRNIETETLKRIADLPNLIGVKDTSGDIEQMMDVLSQIASHRPEFTVISGDDILALPLISLGGQGVVSVVGNLLPQKMVKLVQSALQGDYKAANAIHYELLPLFHAAFLETNPVPIKEALNLCHQQVGGCRLPLCSMKQDNIAKLKAILQQLKLVG